MLANRKDWGGSVRNAVWGKVRLDRVRLDLLQHNKTRLRMPTKVQNDLL